VGSGFISTGPGRKSKASERVVTKVPEGKRWKVKNKTAA